MSRRFALRSERKRTLILTAAASALPLEPEPESAEEADGAETCGAPKDDVEVQGLLVTLFGC